MYYTKLDMKDNLMSWCKDCVKIYNQNNQKDIGWKARKNNELKKTYGISYKEYLIILKEQDGLCAICKTKQEKIHHKSNKQQKLSVDHDHDTGEVRGLLCSKCNFALGGFKDKVEYLQNAITYLTKDTNYGNKRTNDNSPPDSNEEDSGKPE
jgi:hypothetical protein